MCEHEYVYENWVINCYKCGSTWDVTDMVELASRVPVLEREREEWKIRASDLSHTISEMKIGIEGLFSIIRECLPYVHDFVGIASGARILEQQINELLHGNESAKPESGLTQRVLDGARFCPACHALLEEGSVYCDTCGTDTPRQ